MCGLTKTMATVDDSAEHQVSSKKRKKEMATRKRLPPIVSTLPTPSENSRPTEQRGSLITVLTGLLQSNGLERRPLYKVGGCDGASNKN